MKAPEISAIIARKRFSFSTEKDVQNEIEKVLLEHAAPYKREVILDDRNTIDFMVGGIGIEVKIKGGKAAIYKQLERYAAVENINELILITSNSMGEMSLKAGDNVIIYFYPYGEENEPWSEYVTIKGFTCYGVHFEERSWLHWCTERNWYGFGYHGNGHVIYVRYAWQITRAKVLEKVRLEKYNEVHIIPGVRKFDNRRAHMRFERLMWPNDFGYRSRRNARDGGL